MILKSHILIVGSQEEKALDFKDVHDTEKVSLKIIPDIQKFKFEKVHILKFVC
jgi:hypothetical protein